SAGVGAASDTGVMVKTTRAYIQDGATVNAKNDILLSSLSKDVHISTAIGFAAGGSAGVAGTVAVSVVANTTESFTGTGVTLNSQNNITLFAADYATMVLTAGSGAGAGAAGVAAAFAVAVFASQTKAYIGNSNTVNARGVIDIFADTTENVITTVAGGSGGGSAGVAGSLGIKVLSTTTQAYIGGLSLINQDIAYDTATQSINLHANDRVITVGLAGAATGGGAAGVGASGDVTVVRNQTSTYIGDGAWVDAQKDISLAALSDKYVNAAVLVGSGAGAAGIAGSISIIAVGSLFDGEASSGVGNAPAAVDGEISGSSVGNMLGNSSAALQAKATIDGERAGLGISDDFANASTVALNNTQAFIGFNARVNAGEDLTITASDKTVAITGVIAGTGGGAAGVAGVLDVVLIHESAEAFIAAGARTNAGVNTLVSASTSDNIFTAGITGSGAGAAAVNGVAKINVVKSDTIAYIADNAWVNQNVAYQTINQSVSVLADSETYIVTVAGSGGGAGAAAVGGAANVGVLTKNTKAYIGKNALVSARKDIVVSAESTELLVAVTISIYGAGAAAVSGDMATFTFANFTQAYIDTGAVVDSYGNVKVSALDDSLLISIVAVGNGAGAAAVGGALSVNTVVSQTRAYIADGATVNAHGNTVGISAYTGILATPSTLPAGGWDDGRFIDLDGDGVSDVQPVDKSIDLNLDGVDDGDVDGNINFTPYSEGNTSHPGTFTQNINVANEGMGANNTDIVQGLSVTAISNQKIITTTIAIAGAGAAGVTGASTVNVLAAVTEAYIGNNASVNANNSSDSSEQTVRVRAASNALVVMTEGTVGIAGAAGVSGSVNIGIISNITKAYAGGTINARKDIEILARSEEDLHIITANVSGGIAGVGAAAGVGVVSTETLAYILAGAHLNAGRDITVYAYNNAFVNIDTASGAAGGVGVTGAVTVGVITSTTKAYVQNGASLASAAWLYAVRNIKIFAESAEEMIGVAVGAAGGGSAGVAGAVIVKVFSTLTQAFLGAYTLVNQTNSGTVAENQ
ncbi:MAG: hypothetical protein EHM39_01630, partial [Chloroflexi bacterium]